VWPKEGCVMCAQRPRVVFNHYKVPPADERTIIVMFFFFLLLLLLFLLLYIHIYHRLPTSPVPAPPVCVPVYSAFSLSVADRGID